MSDLVERLRAAGSVFAEEEAALLERTPPRDRETLVRRRLAGEPLEQVLGFADVAGVRVHVAPGVFVPRQRSALLVDLAVEHLPPGGLLVELCCGTGALLLAALARRPDVVAHASDLDPAAVACARDNLPPRVEVHCGDLYDALPTTLRGRIDVLLVNAPYVPSDELARLPREARDHEPLVALDGGRDGLAVHRRVAADAPAWLAPGGVLLVEVAPAQAAAATRLLADTGLHPRERHDPERGALAIAGVAAPGRRGRSRPAGPSGHLC